MTNFIFAIKYKNLNNISLFTTMNIYFIEIFESHVSGFTTYKQELLSQPFCRGEFPYSHLQNTNNKKVFNTRLLT